MRTSIVLNRKNTLIVYSEAERTVNTTILKLREYIIRIEGQVVSVSRHTRWVHRVIVAATNINYNTVLDVLIWNIYHGNLMPRNDSVASRLWFAVK